MPVFRLAIVFCTLLLPWSETLARQEPKDERLEEIEGALEESRRERREVKKQSEATEAEIRELTHRLIAGAGRLQELEGMAARSESEIARLDEELLKKRQELLSKDRKVAEILAALQRMSARPVALLVTRPARLVELARSSALLTNITPALEGEARILRSQVEEILDLRTRLEGERADLVDTLDGLAKERSELDRLIALRKDRQRALSTSAKELDQRIAALAREANDLRQLLEGLEREAERRRKAAADAAERLGKTLQQGPAFPSARPFSSARGSLALPARGILVQRFGEDTVTGKAKGIRLRTRPEAQVIAPYDGRVVFAGPFRTYGQLLIIEHGEGYITLLAGLDRIDGIVGQWILAGEPVGIMSGADFPQSAVAESAGAPELYIEIRRFGEPINPLPWLSTGQGKVTG